MQGICWFIIASLFVHNFWLLPHAEFSIAVAICCFVVLKDCCQKLSIVVGMGWEWTGCVPKYFLICPKIGVWLSVLCCISCLPPSQQGLQQCMGAGSAQISAGSVHLANCCGLKLEVSVCVLRTEEVSGNPICNNDSEPAPSVGCGSGFGKCGRRRSVRWSFDRSRCLSGKVGFTQWETKCLKNIGSKHLQRPYCTSERLRFMRQNWWNQLLSLGLSGSRLSLEEIAGIYKIQLCSQR